MRADRTFDRFGRTIGAWRERLARFGDEDFGKTPAGGGWSPGQLSDHISRVHDMFLDFVERCGRGEGEQKRFDVMPWAMCAVGSFPPFRIRVPANVPDPKMAKPDTLTRGQAMERLDAMERRMRDAKDAAATAPRTLRLKHLAAGWVNAEQFYQLAEMHLRHHLRQLGRLEKAL